MNTFCAEEIVPQSVLCNSSLMDDGLVLNFNLRYLNWNSKHGEVPAILDADDYQSILQGKYLFARKFDSRYSNELQLPLAEENSAKWMGLN
jgi:hypothetical protein